FSAMSKEPRKAFALALALFLLFSLPTLSAAQNLPQPEPAPAELTEEQQAGRDFGYGVGSVLASVLYSPLKLTYAGLGLMTGGLGYVLSGGRGEVANGIIYPAVQGHYVITPSHLKGEERVTFIGPPPLDDPQPEPLSPSPTASLR
ncbi:MAG: hypothetical protein ACE5I0_07685, partial [Candidatus Binatia bacterium]